MTDNLGNEGCRIDESAFATERMSPELSPHWIERCQNRKSTVPEKEIEMDSRHSKSRKIRERQPAGMYVHATTLGAAVQEQVLRVESASQPLMSESPRTVRAPR
ncbi:hypothetical protein [Bradyrhizobium sp. CCGUVB23]|uniref:hypothetical protein n=1 Tax=Bradyrhizobium sp. CCGUVB23 TaxID=2949630 RepID=UPI0020B1D15F|nr:hypothetical protein [Bradyrhizobium sp. CCGUVB23]MCP3463829.1 hypothetical protein [Bradyrhizobium sp. CCGUVB23]